MRWVGVDLHKDQFVSCFLAEDGRSSVEKFHLDLDSLEKFRSRLRQDDRLAVEAGRNVWFFVAQVRDAVGEVVVVNASRFAPIAQSRQKTDERDALELARGLRGDYLPRVPIPSSEVQHVRELFAARDTLNKMATQCKNLGHAALARNGLSVSRSMFATGRGRARLRKMEGLAPTDRLLLDVALRQLETVDKELVELEREIIKLGKHLPGLSTVLQVRGLGIISAIGVLAEIGDVHWFPSARKLVGYAGLGASVRRSNQTEHRGGITKQGRKLLRTLLIQAVLAMLKANDRGALVAFFRRKQSEKGSGKAICATARKLLTILHVLLTKQLDYWFLEERLYQQKLKVLARAA
jgi:transposase